MTRPPDASGERGDDGEAAGRAAEDATGDAAAEAERRRRRAAVFGDVLPEGTRDDAPDPGERPGDPGRADRSEEWLRGQVPPHHG